MDSIFVGNDQMALGVIQFATRRGLRIPEDLGIVGFDDISESAYFYPPLTTVKQDQYAVGKLAVEETIKMINSIWHGSEWIEPQPIILPPTLVVRSSSLRGKGQEVNY